MEESLAQTNQVQSAGALENHFSVISAAAVENKKNPRDFFLGFAASFLGSIIFSLVGFLLIAKINSNYQAILTFLVFGWPLVLFGVCLYFCVHFFKRNRSAFWGILIGFFAFLILSAAIARFV